MATEIHRLVNFGANYAGLLATVGYTVRDQTGATVQGRSQAGVYELGNGIYGAAFTVPDTLVGSVYWDTAGGSGVSAAEDIDVALINAGTRLADAILTRKAADVFNAGAPVSLETLYGTIMMILNGRNTAPDTMVVFNPDGSTLGTRHLDTDPDALPVTGVTPP